MTAAPGSQQPDEVPDGSWITEEFERAKERWAELPFWARPVITRPAAPSAQPDERRCDMCVTRPGEPCVYRSSPRSCLSTPAQPVRDTEEGRR